jgi:hypothetical protein
MPMQQMALMHYRAPPVGSSLAAVLNGTNLDGTTTPNPQGVFFNDTAAGGFGYCKNIGLTSFDYVWKTGGGVFSDYAVKIEFVSGDNDLNTTTYNTGVFYTLGGLDAPQWEYTATTSTRTGTYDVMIVENTNHSNILATLQVVFSTNSTA